MKNLFKTSFLILIILITLQTKAQERYSEIIIPTMIPSIGNTFNPYQLTTSMQIALNKKGIATTLKNNVLDNEFCNKLQAVVENGGSIFRCKLNIKLVDCSGITIWEGNGSGISKEFIEGYAEAVESAFETFTEMPVMLTTSNKTKITENNDANIFYGDGYLLKMETENNGNKKLIIINSAEFNYEKSQAIAIMETTDIENIYSIKFTMANNDIWFGMATIDNSIINISISNNGENKKIVLNKKSNN